MTPGDAARRAALKTILVKLCDRSADTRVETDDLARDIVAQVGVIEALFLSGGAAGEPDKRAPLTMTEDDMEQARDLKAHWNTYGPLGIAPCKLIGRLVDEIDALRSRSGGDDAAGREKIMGVVGGTFTRAPISIEDALGIDDDDRRMAALIEVGRLFWEGVKDRTYVEADGAMIAAIARLSFLEIRDAELSPGRTKE